MTQDASHLPAGQWPYPPYQGQPTTQWAPSPPVVEEVPEATAARVVAAAALAGLIAQYLFVGQGAGINIPVWIALVLGSAYVVRTARIDRSDLWLPVAAFAFASFMTLRDDILLIGFDFVATGALTMAAVVAIGGQPITRRGLAAAGRLGGAAMLVAWTGLAPFMAGFRPVAAAMRFNKESTNARILRGLLLAVPLLIVFAALFAAADAVFNAYVRGLVDVRLDSAEWIGRATFAFLAAWLFAGTLAAAWLSRTRYAVPDAVEPQAAGRLNTIEATVVLVALDAMFAIFVLLQAAYLLGGLDTLTVSGLTYSDYARRGFFELIAVAVLAGAVILALNAFVAARTWTFRAAAIVLAGLTGVVLVSSFVRLGLYQAAYGWTELRFYALVAIGWLASGLVATVLGLLVDRARTVPKFMIGAGLAIALLCNAIGPQSFVTTQNVQRVIDPSLVPPDGRTGLDVEYLIRLDADSIPVLVQMGDLLPEYERGRVKMLLASRAGELRSEAEQDGWQSWNLARQRALDALLAAGY